MMMIRAYPASICESCLLHRVLLREEAQQPVLAWAAVLILSPLQGLRVSLTVTCAVSMV